MINQKSLKKLLKPKKLSIALDNIKRAYQSYSSDLEKLKVRQRIRIKDRLMKLKINRNNEKII